MMSNQQIFLMLVQTALLAAQNDKFCSDTRVCEALAEAIFIPASAIPSDKLKLVLMAQEYVDYQINAEVPRPDWYLAEWIPGDW